MLMQLALIFIIKMVLYNFKQKEREKCKINLLKVSLDKLNNNKIIIKSTKNMNLGLNILKNFIQASYLFIEYIQISILLILNLLYHCRREVWFKF